MCADDPLAALERELDVYVRFQRIYGGEPEYSLADALRFHRRQVLANLRDEADEMWLRRNGMLEKLAELKGVDLTSEPQLKDIVDENMAKRGRTATLW